MEEATLPQWMVWAEVDKRVLPTLPQNSSSQAQHVLWKSFPWNRALTPESPIRTWEDPSTQQPCSPSPAHCTQMSGEESPSQESGFVQWCLMALASFSLAMGTCHNYEQWDTGRSQLGRGWLMEKRISSLLKRHTRKRYCVSASDYWWIRTCFLKLVSTLDFVTCTHGSKAKKQSKSGSTVTTWSRRINNP